MKLYNSLSKQTETFTSIHKDRVGMYVCGITPYDTTHLGHAFTYTAFDVLFRVLQAQGYTVNYTQNVTDVDDDILKRAARDSVDWKALGMQWTERYVQDMQALNNLRPTHFVKATETIETILEIITKLVKDGYAYENEGNVYFEVSKDPEYGKLSQFTETEMIALSKERGADPNDPRKRAPLDFILWQKSLPEEPSWDSAWGKGRPGWHIECSAMAYKYIDNKLDIHGGGSDLIYPHHESEIAQSEHYTGQKPFVSYWMHTGAVGYKGEKMSKSLGNLVLVSKLIQKYDPHAIRYLLLSHHYREPWEYFETDLKLAAKKVKALTKKLESDNEATKSLKRKKSTIQLGQSMKQNSLAEFMTMLSNDLDTPRALGMLDETLNQGKREVAHEMWNLLGFTFSAK